MDLPQEGTRPGREKGATRRTVRLALTAPAILGGLTCAFVVGLDPKVLGVVQSNSDSAPFGRSRAEARCSLVSGSARDGDLVFRRGRGVASAVVLAVDPGAEYSHVGIVVGGRHGAFVVHVEPGDGTPESDRVRMEPLDVFISEANASRFALLRPPAGMEDVVRGAARRALGFWRLGLSFDHRFDLSSGETLYCTELVRNAYADAGLDIGARCRLTHLQGANRLVLTPGALAEGLDFERLFPGRGGRL